MILSQAFRGWFRTANGLETDWEIEKVELKGGEAVCLSPAPTTSPTEDDPDTYPVAIGIFKSVATDNGRR